MSFFTKLFTSSFLTWFLLSLNTLLSISIPLPENKEFSNTKCKKRELFHNETFQCYRERTKGPCGGTMIFVKSQFPFGECDCTEDGVVPWVYHQETNDCYDTYKQSYCASGEWLIFDSENRTPICTRNLCNAEKVEDEEYPIVLFKGKCVPLNKPSEELCGPSQEIRIRNYDVIPECISSLQEFSVTSTNQLKCRPGTRRDRNGTCKRTVTILSSDY